MRLQFKFRFVIHKQNALNNKSYRFRELRQFWRKMGDLGFLGITAEPEFGGTGGSYIDHCIIMEEISR